MFKLIRFAVRKYRKTPHETTLFSLFPYNGRYTIIVETGEMVKYLLKQKKSKVSISKKYLVVINLKKKGYEYIQGVLKLEACFLTGCRTHK